MCVCISTCADAFGRHYSVPDVDNGGAQIEEVRGVHVCTVLYCLRIHCLFDDITQGIRSFRTYNDTGEMWTTPVHSTSIMVRTQTCLYLINLHIYTIHIYLLVLTAREYHIQFNVQSACALINNSYDYIYGNWCHIYKVTVFLKFSIPNFGE